MQLLYVCWSGISLLGVVKEGWNFSSSCTSPSVAFWGSAWYAVVKAWDLGLLMLSLGKTVADQFLCGWACSVAVFSFLRQQILHQLC